MKPFSRPLRAKHLLPLPLAFVALAICAPLADAGAGKGKITGTLGALPKSAEFAAVQAIDPNGEIAGVTLTGGSGAFNLSVPAGTYLLASNAAEGESALSAFSPPKQVRKGRKITVHAKLKSLGRASASVTKSLLPKGSILTVTGFEFTDDTTTPESVSQLGALLLNDLFGPCTKKGFVFVDTSPEFVKFAQQERALSLSGKLATPFEYRPLKAQYEVFGSASYERERLLLSLTATTPAHLDVPGAEVQSESTVPSLDFDGLQSALAKLSSQFAAKVCGAS